MRGRERGRSRTKEAGRRVTTMAKMGAWKRKPPLVTNCIERGRKGERKRGREGKREGREEKIQ